MRIQSAVTACLLSLGLAACAQNKLATVAVAGPDTADTKAGQGSEDHRPHAGMLRFPDVSDSHIVFVYANDIWMVPREGGLAVPLASPPGQETFPRFSADGRTIAFVGNYDGNRDLYTIPVQGGVPSRVTHHSAGEVLCDWTPDDGLLYFANGLAGLPRQTQLFTVAATGGMPEKLPVPYGANGAISPDGTWLAYTPHTRDHRTWKRYRGGMATDIWLFNLKDHSSKRITDWEGTDSQPMWHGRMIYYLSDAGPEHRLNIWSYDTANGKREQVTGLTDFDIKWPAIGPGAEGGGEIVFQAGPSLYLLDLASRELVTVDVRVPGDRPAIHPHRVDADEFIQSWGISSTGKRAVIEARGDVWTVPAKHGSPRNLTRTSGSAERDGAWSPDGEWIAYFGDRTGEYELYLAAANGRGETRQLTHGSKTYYYNPTWSPDSKRIAFTDKSGAMYLHTIESGETINFDTDPLTAFVPMSWSSDSAWIAYPKNGDNRLTSIWLYHVADGTKQQVTSGMFQDTWPTFDRKGDYLFFASNRDFTSPLYEDVGTTFVYADTDLLIAVPLRAEVGVPWPPKSDEEGADKDETVAENGKEKADENKPSDGNEEESGDEGKDNSDDNDDDSKNKDEPEPVVIELDGFEGRAMQLPVKRGTFSQLAVNHKGNLLYVRRGPRGGDEEPALKILDMSDKESKSGGKGKNGGEKEATVIDGVRAFAMSADGKKIIVRKGQQGAIVDAAKDQKLDSPLALDAMDVRIDPREEWHQMFLETWRVERDFFYDPHMHGVDWDAMRKHYEPMIDDCLSREDVDFVLGELIAELNVGHAYVRGGGDREDEPSVSVGMLGVDWELHDGAYRIAKIYEGAPWDVNARGPLSRPGVDVSVGDYVLAVNRVPLDTAKDPWASFQGMAGRTVTLTVSDKPVLDDNARDVIVKLLDSEWDLRFRAWIEDNRAYVADKSDGRVGYIYVPNTGIQGQNELFRQFYGQVDKQALIIDERWNGGGQIPTRFVELLNRPIANYWARRDGRDWTWPPDAHQGPKCMLINGLAGSGGDYFPWYFKKAGVGKLVGMRTWGGLVGISGNPRLIDGGFITAPTFAFYEADGTWGVEGYGVDPDIEVIDDPALMVDGGDPQLDAAIDLMLKEIKRNPYEPPKRPDYPDRSGMGITESDK